VTAISSGQALRMAQHALLGSDSAQIDAELLLAAALGATRAGLYAWPERALTPAERTRFEALLERRILGEPLAYILEEREFWTLRLRVTPAVLIPRPETELLVETALGLAGSAAAKALRVADLGTGSGAIALALASERPHWQLLATDQSAAALQVASDNAVRLGIRNIGFRQGSWCEALPEGLFDMILSNPPYIAPGDAHLGRGDLRFEPSSALVAAEQGLADLRAICRAAARHLAPGGWLLLEHGFEQGPAVRQLLANAGFCGVRTLADLNALPRVTLGCLEGQRA
jgi:release factor glutamine methyltransferase